MATILVTGGAGYIGSHTCVELLAAGHDVVVVDDLCNSSAEAVRRVGELAGRPVDFHRVDVSDRAALDAVFAAAPVDSVIHFAGLKAVGESVAEPRRYYAHNLGSTLTLLEVMEAHGVRDIVFSSSATVYGEAETVPVTEGAPTGPTNPYGRTKWMIEHILTDVAASDDAWRISLLRYFNPVGAHPSGRIGEDPLGIPNNLMPFVMQVAVGRLPELAIFGDDYPTPDGTCLRDYIHVVDLARGHLAALEHLRPGVGVYNLGTGVATSVKQVVAAATSAVGAPIPSRVAPRRPGDVAAVYADPARAAAELGWRAELDIEAMCRDHWNWQRQNPDGYPEN
ncbi:MAG: UDP-glucose 4-epimerase GalE [Acidimicrobiales bacterium]|nr:UDP-glucose 4-epimerase GalE [Acidimicrobiales bacterium]